MDQEKLVALLESAANVGGERTPFCAQDLEIAAYVDAALASQARLKLQRHLADCAVCNRRVGVLMQSLRDADDADPAPQAALERARRVGRRTQKHAAPRWAAAAVFVLAIFVASNFMPDTDIGVISDQAPTRTLISSPSSLQVLSPEPGIVADADELIFRWHAVDGSLHYDLRIVTASGDLVTEQRVIKFERDCIRRRRGLGFKQTVHGLRAREISGGWIPPGDLLDLFL